MDSTWNLSNAVPAVPGHDSPKLRENRQRRHIQDQDNQIRKLKRRFSKIYEQGKRKKRSGRKTGSAGAETGVHEGEERRVRREDEGVPDVEAEEPRTKEGFGQLGRRQYDSRCSEPFTGARTGERFSEKPRVGKLLRSEEKLECTMRNGFIWKTFWPTAKEPWRT
ncbi:hypothetical protein L596_027458 [Steinernema carpocapsae]|uniref:Uncharacterized protein n=1 Tax=Steinernema carpocapsae TaxID=34508 RepID=A0A4U5LVK1_STECR|nr:hypothetical protein L596_027458 [Steinernema carpocapsae]